MFSPRKLTTAAIIYGRTHESIATRKFQEVYDGISVSPTGLFIHPDHNFLAASLDGKMGLDTLLEIKCPYSGREEEIDVGPHFPFLEMRDGELALKKSHNYYYQCQGQMACSQIHTSFFVVYTSIDLFIERIDYDDDFFCSPCCRS